LFFGWLGVFFCDLIPMAILLSQLRDFGSQDRLGIGENSTVFIADPEIETVARVCYLAVKREKGLDATKPLK